MVEELFAIDALDAVEVLGGESCLVRLEVADELPVERGGGPGGLRAFILRFLDPVFTDATQAVAGGVVGGEGRVGLGDRKKFDPARIAPGGGAGGGDLAADGIGPVGKFFVTDQHGWRWECEEGGGLSVENLIRGLRNVRFGYSVGNNLR